MTIELTRFTAADGEALLAARPAMLADFAADREGFRGARLVRLAGDEWLDLVEWADALALEASRAKGGNLPGIRAFFAAIDALISSEAGEDAALDEGSSPES
ncbi:hypothetical protein ABIQ69_15180 [Agromyces sp. G08B096]|uniref:ABM domain-containing protein n=1 Tax=Agromyces sp. G08B096 TaxID=3156399 RepID=A0AAU7W5Q5_9MICO